MLVWLLRSWKDAELVEILDFMKGLNTFQV